MLAVAKTFFRNLSALLKVRAENGEECCRKRRIVVQSGGASTATTCRQCVIQIGCFCHFKNRSLVRIRKRRSYASLSCVHKVRDAISSIGQNLSALDGKTGELLRIELCNVWTEASVNHQVNSFEIEHRPNPSVFWRLCPH